MYGCYNASSAVSRLVGLNFNKFIIKSIASSEADGNIFYSFLVLISGKLSSMVWATGLLIESKSSWFGLPVTLIIVSN